MKLSRARLALLLCSVFCVGTLALAQDKSKDSGAKKGSDAKKSDDDKDDMKKDSKESARIRGFLPANYRKLGLSDEQRQNIYRIQAEYDDRIKDLEEQISKMKSKRNKEVEGVLTAAQRARLKEIQDGKN